MFIGTRNAHSTRSPRELNADVVFGQEILRIGMPYFIMSGRRCIGIGTITGIEIDARGTSIDFALDESISAPVKKFAESHYAALVQETAGPRTYAESAGTSYQTSTMDGMTAMMTGRDRDVADIARGRSEGTAHSLAEMMGWESDQDDY